MSNIHEPLAGVDVTKVPTDGQTQTLRHGTKKNRQTGQKKKRQKKTAQGTKTKTILCVFCFCVFLNFFFSLSLFLFSFLSASSLQASIASRFLLTFLIIFFFLSRFGESTLLRPLFPFLIFVCSLFFLVFLFLPFFCECPFLFSGAQNLIDFFRWLNFVTISHNILEKEILEQKTVKLLFL